MSDLPRVVMVATAAFTPGMRVALSRAAPASRRVWALALVLIGLSSALLHGVVRAGMLTVRRARGEVYFDGQVLLTVKPFGASRPVGALVSVGLALIASVLVIFSALVELTALAPDGVRTTLRLLLVASALLPLPFRLQPHGVAAALKAHQQAYGAALVADLAKWPRAPGGAGRRTVRSYLSLPGRPPVVGVANDVLWDKVYSPAGLQSLAIDTEWRWVPRKVRRRRWLVYA